MANKLKLSAHIGYLFKELPLERRVEAARAAGFDAVEHPQPFEMPAARMRTLIDAAGVSYTQIGVAASERGLACLPDRRQDFRDLLARSLDYAGEVGCRLVHPMAGIKPRDSDPALVWETYHANIRYALDAASARGMSVIIEAVSPAGTPGFLIDSAARAFAVIDTLDDGRATLLLDAFHCWAGGEDFAALLEARTDRIGHIHAAGFPGRHEPDTGDHDFDFLLPLLARKDYAGAIGFEYMPAAETTAGLGWLAGWRAARDALLSK